MQLGIQLLFLLSSANSVLEAEASARLLSMEIINKHQWHLLQVNALPTWNSSSLHSSHRQQQKQMLLGSLEWRSFYYFNDR